MGRPWFLAMSLGLACGPSGTTSPNEANGRDGGTSRGPFPEGPYGSATGETLADYRFSGYVTPSSRETQTLEATSLAALRQDVQRRWLLLNVAGEWCEGCREEAELFALRYTEWRTRGGEVLTVLIEDRARNPALQRHLDRWVEAFSLINPVVLDPEGFVLTEVRPQGLPLNLIVDLETMRVVERRPGADPELFLRFEARLD